AEVRDKAEQRLKDLVDKKKQQLAQKLAKQFENLNATWTDHFAKQLTRYTAILQKMQARSDIAAGKGKDVTAVNATIQSAKTVIATAQTAVTAQAAKIYTLDPSAVATTTTATTTSSGQEELKKNLKIAFQNLHSTLFKDLFALRDGPMTDVRKALQNALAELGKIPGVDEDNETATSTEKSNQ
ncbi:MAG: hypothetical protein WA058_03950, partial [Minisyncoccia bacterium]